METKEQARKRGKKSRKSGAAFERRVREDLESKGWIVSKWQNTVEWKDNSGIGSKDVNQEKIQFCVPAKAKFNPFTKQLMMNSAGFPDFIALTRTDSNATYPVQNIGDTHYLSGIRCWIFVEAKSNGTLSKEEKEKAKWYLENNYCSKFLIAYKTKQGRRIKVEYKEYGTS